MGVSDLCSPDDRLRLDTALTTLVNTPSARTLPFRHNRTPYTVLLTEFALQQTTMTAALPYIERFLTRWPTIFDLADDTPEAVLAAWSGLGYYRRARALHATCQAIVRDHGGVVPSSPAILRTLPGIGPYTAGAIASIAYGVPVAAVDGNVLRVVARLLAWPLVRTDQASLEAVRNAVTTALVTSRVAPGRANEALMDLSATHCRPKSPRCDACTLSALCRAHMSDSVASYPLAPQHKTRPTDALAYVCVTVNRHDGLAVLLRRRTETLLHGTYEPILWTTTDRLPRCLQEAPWRSLPPRRHVFSHRVWTLRFDAVTLTPSALAPDGTLVIEDRRYAPFRLDRLSDVPLASPFRATLTALAETIANDDEAAP